MSEREAATKMDMQIVIDADEASGVYAELGQATGGAIRAYVEGAGNTEGAAEITWTREQAIAFHSRLGHLLYS